MKEKKIVRIVSFLLAIVMILTVPLSINAQSVGDISIGSNENGTFSATIPLAVELNTNGGDTIVSYSLETNMEPYRGVGVSLCQNCISNVHKFGESRIKKTNGAGFESIKVSVYTKDMLQAGSVDILNYANYVYGKDSEQKDIILKTSQMEFSKGEYFIPIKFELAVIGTINRAPGLYEINGYNDTKRTKLLTWDELTGNYKYNPQKAFTKNQASSGVEGTLLYAIKKYQTDNNYTFSVGTSSSPSTKSYMLIFPEEITELKDYWLSVPRYMTLKVVLPRNNYSTMDINTLNPGWFTIYGIIPKDTVRNLQTTDTKKNLVDYAYVDFGQMYFECQYPYEIWTVDNEIIESKEYTEAAYPR